MISYQILRSSWPPKDEDQEEEEEEEEDDDNNEDDIEDNIEEEEEVQLDEIQKNQSTFEFEKKQRQMQIYHKNKYMEHM